MARLSTNLSLCQVARRHSLSGGISRSYLAAHGAPFAVVWPHLLSYASSCDFLVTHNLAFDLRMLTNSYCEVFPWCDHPSDAVLDSLPQQRECSMELFRSLFPLFRTDLDSVCYALGVESRRGAHHGALQDASLLSVALSRMIGKVLALEVI
jgi:DNA polymerase III epsilon subunit-like protein